MPFFIVILLDEAQLQTVLAISNVLVAVGLLIFAALQWRVTKRQYDLQDRAEAHDAEMEDRAIARQQKLDDSEVDAALSLIKAEFYRLHVPYDVLCSEGFPVLLIGGTLDYSSFRVTDPSHLMTQFAKLGFLPATIGATAVRHQGGVATILALLDANIALHAGDKRRDTAYMEAHIRAMISNLDSKIENTRELMREALRAFDDAIRCSPRAYFPHPLTWPSDLRSDAAQNLRQIFPSEVRAAELRVGPDGRDVLERGPNEGPVTTGPA